MFCGGIEWYDDLVSLFWPKNRCPESYHVENNVFVNEVSLAGFTY
ncbi:hypothetical protein BA1DRAFT_03885 [Photorhabdus aegyptia]|uniref:Uncharacterized protein n=1 Tax=Photorhabdus aegyptia TaxID=2805098 RepID=A0A022PGP3_9GAMM|nr:hypothetical protein BA1DRAFT_03885 [Photorhabdus aegyptia]